MHTTSVVWNTNYIRCIENQLDFTHLPFVHESTIGAKLPKGRMTVRTQVEGDRIRGWAEETLLEPGDVAGEPPKSGYVELIAPNAWILTFSRSGKMVNLLAFVPVDETHTRIYLRLHQRLVTIPGLAWLVGWTMNAVNRVILNQDRRVVEGSLPPRPTPDVREMLVPTDAPIIAYRRMLTREAKARRRSLPVIGVSANAAEPASDDASPRLERTG